MDWKTNHFILKNITVKQFTKKSFLKKHQLIEDSCISGKMKRFNLK